MEDELDLGAGPATIKDAGTAPVWEVTPTISRGQQEKEQATKEAVGTSITDLPDTVRRSFRSGGNVGYQVYRQLDRAIDAGPIDDQWRQGGGADWAERNKIPHAERWRYTTARNQREAETLLEDKQLWARDAAILSERTGLMHTAASMLPGIIDIDTPFTIGAGALLSGTAKAAINASKFGQIAAGAAGGAASGAALGLVQDASDPNADWTVIPLYALAGTAFGAAGGGVCPHG